MKACQDCKHFDWRHLCQAPQLIRTFIDVVTGERTDKQTYRKCEDVRKDGLIMSYVNDTCGRRARWFESKTKVKGE